MARTVTAIVPPLFVAQITGMYRIDISARVVKAYRYDGTVSHKILRSKLPPGFETADFVHIAGLIRAAGERIGV